MRTFKNFNSYGKSRCPICNSNDDKETVLIGIVGTEKNGNIEAKQFHLECIDLFYYQKENLIAKKIYTCQEMRP